MVKIINAQLEILHAQLFKASKNGDWKEAEYIECKIEVLYEVLNKAIIQGVNDPELFKK